MSDIHTCGYYCDRLACIKAQRDELRDKFQVMQAQALQSGEPVALERVDVHLQIVYDECQIVIEPDPQGSLVYYDNVVRVMQAAQQPPTTKPIAAVKGWFHGGCVIQAIDPEAVLPAGMALYADPQPVVPEVRVLSRDEARLALWRAIQEVVVGNPTDDKLILENLYRSGVWLCLLSAGKGGE